MVIQRFMLLLALGAALVAAGACDEQPPESPLIQAARAGSLDRIKLLLDAGADVNLPGPTGDGWDATPLQHAILARQSGAAVQKKPDGARLTGEDRVLQGRGIPAVTRGSRQVQVGAGVEEQFDPVE